MGGGVGGGGFTVFTAPMKKKKGKERKGALAFQKRVLG